MPRRTLKHYGSRAQPCPCGQHNELINLVNMHAATHVKTLWVKGSALVLVEFSGFLANKPFEFHGEEHAGYSLHRKARPFRDGIYVRGPVIQEFGYKPFFLAFGVYAFRRSVARDIR